MVGEREPLYRVEVGPAKIPQRGLHDAIANPPQGQAHERPEQGQPHVKAGQVPWMIRHVVGDSVLEPVDGHAGNTGQAHLQTDAGQEQDDREDDATAITGQKGKHTEQIPRPEGRRGWWGSIHSKLPGREKNLQIPGDDLTVK